MMPGPTVIRKCSACGNLIAEHTIVSGNTFEARFWTDGKRDAPMLPDAPWLVKCTHCGAHIWIDEQEQVGEIESWGQTGRNDANFKDVRPPSTPSLQDYLTTLAKGVLPREKEKYLRLRAWWAGNDGRREKDRAGTMLDEELTNLRSFVQLLDEADENDRILKAEAMRELGRFAEAEALLAKPFSEELTQAAAIVSDFTRQKIQSVREMKFQ